MSTGLECVFVEDPAGRWFYLLELGSAPKSAWDWREYAEAFGPFSSVEAARDHLHAHHANPGGYSVLRYAADGWATGRWAEFLREAER